MERKILEERRIKAIYAKLEGGLYDKAREREQKKKWVSFIL